MGNRCIPTLIWPGHEQGMAEGALSTGGAAGQLWLSPSAYAAPAAHQGVLGDHSSPLLERSVPRAVPCPRSADEAVPAGWSAKLGGEVPACPPARCRLPGHIERDGIVDVHGVGAIRGGHDASVQLFRHVVC